MKFMRITKRIYGYRHKEDNDKHLWVLSLPLCDSTGACIRNYLCDPNFKRTTGNNYGVIIEEEDTSKVVIFDIFDDDLDNPLSITLDRNVMINLLEQFEKLEEQQADEIIIEQDDNGKFSIRGVFYPKSANA
jgi:hypothetical protein